MSHHVPPLLSYVRHKVVINVGRAGAANLDVIQEVEPLGVRVWSAPFLEKMAV